MLGPAALQRILAADVVCSAISVSAHGSASYAALGQSFAGPSSETSGSQTLSWESVRPSLPVMPPYVPKTASSGETCSESLGLVLPVASALAVIGLAVCRLRRATVASLQPAKASDQMDADIAEKAASIADIPEVPSSDAPTDVPSDVPTSTEDVLSDTSSDRPSLCSVLTDATFLRDVEDSSEAFAIRIQIQALAKEAFGDSSDGGCEADEHLAALLLNDEVVAYACYLVRRNFKSLSVSKLAVAPSHRRRGLGRLLLRHLVRLGKARGRGQQPLERICLSALPDSVAFYEACGFRPDPSVKVPSSTDLVEGQVYMEYELRKKPRK